MKILVIEDDATIVEFISLAFEVGWPNAELVSTHQGSIGIELVESESPDVVILDIGLPDVDGFEVLKQIRLFSKVPVIIVTVRDTEADIVKGLEFGADEYMVKPFGQLELLARIRTVLRSRQISLDTDTTIVSGPLALNPATGQLTCGSTTVQITRTEALILVLLMKKVGHVVTYDELAEVIWGDVYAYSTSTLRVYIRRLRAKLGSYIQQKAHIHSKPGVGYILETTQSGHLP